MQYYFILVLIPLLLSFYVSWKFKSTFARYSKTAMQADLSGKQIAEKMLADNNISDVQVISVEGNLTDHYNPQNKTVNLSPEVYHGRSIASAAVAAHECGHALQHARAFAWLNLRSAIVPFVSITSRYVQWILLAGILMIQVFPYLLWIGIILFAASVIFSFVTLPVEFDASKRALRWLETSQISTANELTNAKGALKWAAMTYVVVALASLGTLLYYIMIAVGGRRE